MIKRLTTLPNEKEIAYQVNNGSVEFTVPRLETFMMLALDYE
jgi:cysteinyl-tRNA synthetase